MASNRQVAYWKGIYLPKLIEGILFQATPREIEDLLINLSGFEVDSVKDLCVQQMDYLIEFSLEFAERLNIEILSPSEWNGKAYKWDYMDNYEM